MNYDALNKELDAAINRIELLIDRWRYMSKIYGCEDEAIETMDSLSDIRDGMMDRYRYYDAEQGTRCD